MTELVIVLIALVAIVAVAGIIIVFLAYRAARKQRKKAEYEAYRPRDPFAEADTDALRGDPRRLKAGDMVDVRGENFAVRGTLRLSEGAYTWTEQLLDTGTGTKRWLSVEEDPDLELVLWTEVRDVAVAPGPRELQLDGRHYTSHESGRAGYTGEGTTGLNPQGTVRYHDYRSADGTRLSFEDFGETGKWECARGEVLTRYDVTIFSA